MSPVHRAGTALLRLLIFLALVAIALAAVLPLVYMAINTVRTSTEYVIDPLGWPEDWSYFDNFVAMHNVFNMPQLLINTLTYIGLALAISLFCSVPAAFTFAKYDFPHRRLLYMMMIGSLSIPVITFILPDYLLFSRVGLIDKAWGISLLWAATSVPPTVFLLSALMRGLPGEVMDAAKVDGAGHLRMLAGIALPMSIPGLIIVTIFNVTIWWNDLLLPLIFLQSDEKKTVTLAVAGLFGRYTGDFPLLMTGLLLASLPPIILYIVLQGHIQKGLIIGAVK